MSRRVAQTTWYPPAGVKIVPARSAIGTVLLLIGWMSVACTSTKPAWAQREASTHASGNDSSVSSSSTSPSASVSQEAADSVVELTPEQLEAAEIRVQPCTRRLFSQSIEVTGKVTLNEDRIAHIYPMVSGVADELKVQLGNDVEANQVLAVIHSPEVGRMKLDLYQARVDLEVARTRLDLFTHIADNTARLLEALKSGATFDELEKRFEGAHMGDYRSRLLLAYASYLKSEADLQRLAGIGDTGAVPQKAILSAKVKRDADRAVYQATIEEVEHELKTRRLELMQQMRQAESKVTAGVTQLRVLGVAEQDIAQIDPEMQKEAISHYPVRAPFAGVIIKKDIAYGERVTPDKLLFSVADLSEVWITADIFEQHLPLLHDLAGATISIRSSAWPDREFSAEVFYTGDIVDEATRTVGLRARTANPHRLLKPGMFVTVFLPDVDAQMALVVPVEAIQEHENRSFVFVELAPGRYVRRDVQVITTNRSLAAIGEGLREGEKVVTHGGFVLKSLLLSSLLEEE